MIPARRGELGRAAAVVGSGIATTVLFFHRAVFSADIFIARDVQRVYYPLKQFWAERVRAGDFPEWFPYDSLGQPFVGMVISGAFHPFNVFYLLFPLGVALKLSVLLCFPFAFAGAALLARRLLVPWTAAALGGVIYAFNGYCISLTNNPLYLTALSTTPWALWAADRFLERRSPLRTLVAAVTLALVLFAGDAQAFAVTCAAVVVLAAARGIQSRSWNALASIPIALVCAAGVAAIQLLPAFGMLSSVAAGARTLDDAQLWSTHPLRFLELPLGPLFLTEPGSPKTVALYNELLKTGMSTLWADSLHIGVPATMLACVALWSSRRRRVTWLLLGIGLLVAWLMLGKYGGLYGLVYKLVPVWRPFRYPEKLAPYLLLIAALGAASGLSLLLQVPEVRKRVASAFAAVGVLLLLGCGLELGWKAYSHGLLVSLWSGTPIPEVVAETGARFIQATLYSGMSALVLALAISQIHSPTLFGGVCVAVAAVPLVVQNEAIYQLTFPDVLKDTPGFVSIIRSREPPNKLGGFRVGSLTTEYILPDVDDMNYWDANALYVAAALDPVTPALFGVESSDRYLPGVSHRVELLGRSVRTWVDRYSGWYSTKYVSMSERFFREIGGNRDTIIAHNKKLRLLLLENPTALPRAYLAQLRCASSDEEVRAIMEGPSFRPRHEAMIVCGGRAPSTEPPVDGRVEVVSYDPELIELSVQGNTNAVVVITDAHHSGWTATVDGHPADVLVTNFAVRGVKVGPGSHRVVFRYRTPYLRVGGVITMMTLCMLCAAALLRTKFRQLM